MIADLLQLAGRFEPIELDELDRRISPLGSRTDQKYVVRGELLPAFAAALAPGHLALEIAGRRAFRYETVYFDTPELLTYHQHHQGRRRRFKCRTRLYADSGLCSFEVKLRDGRDRTMKRKLVVDRSEHGVLGDESRGFLDAVLREAYGRPAPADLAPVLTTTFMRVTLAARSTPERLTCDGTLAFAAADDGRRFSIAPGLVLVETKTRRGNGAADRVLRGLGARPVSACSKYCLGVALSQPHLRRNRFSRLLRRHFEPLAPAAPVAA